MSMGREFGSRTGGGGVLNQDQMKIHTRKLQGEIFQELIDLNKDPYFGKNHLGSFECKLCMTTHVSEQNYLAHTKGRRHRMGLQARARLHAQQSAAPAPAPAPAPSPLPPLPAAPLPTRALGAARAHSGGHGRQQRIHFDGHHHHQQQARPVLRPRYLVERQQRPDGRSLAIRVDYAKIDADAQPQHRFVSAVEQVVEPPDLSWQYLVVAAPPYENIAFKLPAWVVVHPSFSVRDAWDPVKRSYSLDIRYSSTST